MKKIMLLLLLMITNAHTSEVQNRDGCKAFADACICSNTGLSGFCLPGWMSSSDEQLYCDCSSDTLAEDDVINLMIRRYCSTEENTGGLALQLRHRMQGSVYAQRSYKILDKMYALLGDNPTEFDVSGKNTAKLQRNTQNFLKLREDLKKATRLEPVLTHFFIPGDGICTYVNQECTCSNTGRKGVCSVKRNARLGERLSLICHCD